MREHRATRTLVKSAPELWLTCSEESLLARHLEPFGEIRVTRLEPERTVAWEGEAASGTVLIEPSGWGTRVTLTASIDMAGDEGPQDAGPDPDTDAGPDPEADAGPDPEANAGLTRRVEPHGRPATHRRGGRAVGAPRTPRASAAAGGPERAGRVLGADAPPPPAPARGTGTRDR